jgi:hypothetical protein
LGALIKLQIHVLYAICKLPSMASAQRAISRSYVSYLTPQVAVICRVSSSVLKQIKRFCGYLDDNPQFELRRSGLVGVVCCVWVVSQKKIHKTPSRKSPTVARKGEATWTWLGRETGKTGTKLFALRKHQPWGRVRTSNGKQNSQADARQLCWRAAVVNLMTNEQLRNTQSAF